MAVVTLRVDDGTRDELERVAQERGLTVSALLRSAVDGLLGRDVERSWAEAPRTLGLMERQMLALQHKILAEVSAEDHEQKQHRKRAQVLQDGYTGLYDEVFLAVSPELSASDCGLVMDLLDMFTVLQVALGKLDEQTKAELGGRARWLEFSGFDFSDPLESKMAGYANFLIEDGRWETLAHHFDSKSGGGNSHTRMVDRYRRLLTAYNGVMVNRRAKSGPTLEAYQLDAAALRTILDAVDLR
ncbi:YfbU family protein [Actinokineospora sp. PR83]|uniref:YfbU family protein n=1 Tax=Actinokineospora sp. PR83 TaxID=2884908 RepID=UPI001F40958F|nr:YfbU family protein [Actinokineospora sp. PR83]MCG8919425.1 YfbU family protein [Actinokineospora sp. PR83]